MSKREKTTEKEFKSIEKRIEKSNPLVNVAKRNFLKNPSSDTLVKGKLVKNIMVRGLMNKKEGITEKEFKSIEINTEQNRILVNSAKRSSLILQSSGTLAKVRPAKIIMVLGLMSKKELKTEKE